MTPHSRVNRTRRRKSAPSIGSSPMLDQAAWDRMVDALAMHLCPSEEWQEYEKKVQYQVWKANLQQNSARVKVFPIWRKYRYQAQQIASLQKAVPILRHLPLPVTSFLGRVLFS